MEKSFIVTFFSICFWIIFTAPTCNNTSNSPIKEPLRHYTVAFNHAPIHYQDTDSDRPKADYITSFNYDGNWIGRDNWDNLNQGDLTAKVYFSVVESETHWFISYLFFHPQDWDDVGAPHNEHENDMEGCLVFCRKNSGDKGQVEGIVTQAHGKWYTYYNENTTVRPKASRNDKKLVMEEIDGFERIKTTQESKGHGCYAFGHIEKTGSLTYYTPDFTDVNIHDGIIYYPHINQPEEPASGWEPKVHYTLVDVFGNQGVFTRQITESINPQSKITYHNWGVFRGDESGGCGDGWDTCSENAAGAPWNWNTTIGRGMMAFDPAAFVKAYFKNLGQFSETYISNPYLQKLEQAGFDQNNRPGGMPSNINLEVLYGKLNSGA